MTDRAGDEENTPLLRDPEDVVSNPRPPTSFAERVNSVAQEPLTPLTKILLILALVLLLASSVFIGLFAGAQHKLNVERGDGGNGHTHPPKTVTVTATATTTATTSATTTTTSTAVSTATTSLPTTVTLPAPIPVPTIPPEDIPCLKPHCVILSASIISSLDVSQDPCENFYDFANGGWLKKHPLPADKSSLGNFEVLSQQNKRVIQEILESKSSAELAPSPDSEILTKLRDSYSACLNEERLDSIGSAPLLHFIKTLRRLYRKEDTEISLLPGIDSGLTAAIAFLHSKGIESLFSFEIEGDVGTDPNFMVPWFSQPKFGLPSKEYYEDKAIRKVYKDVVERLLLVLTEEEEKDISQSSPVLVDNDDDTVWPPWPWPPWGDDDDDGHKGDDKGGNRSQEIRILAKKVVAFESKLAQASLDLDILYQDPIATYNPVPISNLTDSLPQLDFATYFSTFTPRTFPDRVILTDLTYATSLSKILDDTASEVIEAYLTVRAALALSPYLGMTTEAWQAQRSLVETLTGIKKGAVGDRAEYCIGKVEETLGFAAGRYFVNETFRGDSREKGTKVISDIVEAFKTSLPHIDWMDKKSAMAAAEKADAIRVKVGYPLSPNTRNARSIANYYNTVKVDKLTFFENMLSAATSDQFKKWLQLGRQRNRETWEMFPSTVNAYFNPPSNEIVFPAGIMQPPFFSHDWPGYISYGAFGHVAAHELTHAFDSAGRLYNQKGKLEEWWTNSTSKGFNVKQRCIVDQYSEYTIDDGHGGKIHVNGNLTSGENIGDTGLIQAYRAWKAQYHTSVKEGGEYVLPGLNFTREQLFFISFARIWARAMKPAAAVQRIRTDPHSPTRYRVDGTVSNIPEFAKAFKCSKTAKLNPPTEKQCIFWS